MLTLGLMDVLCHFKLNLTLNEANELCLCQLKLTLDMTNVFFLCYLKFTSRVDFLDHDLLLKLQSLNYITTLAKKKKKTKERVTTASVVLQISFSRTNLGKLSN